MERFKSKMAGLSHDAPRNDQSEVNLFESVFIVAVVYIKRKKVKVIK